MADLLTHVLMAYIVAKLLSLRYEWITSPYLTAAMLGGVLPDLNRIDLLLSADTIEAVTGLPFSWGGLHRGGPVFVLALIIAYLVQRPYRKRVFTLIALGVGLHLVSDLFLGSGLAPSYALMWPLSGWEPVVPGFFNSRDIRIAPMFMVLSAATWVFVEWRKASTDPRRSLSNQPAD